MAASTDDDIADARAGVGSARAVNWRRLVTLGCRLVLAAVFAWSGGAKVTEAPALQKLAVSSYKILPDSWAGPVGYALPILELALAALLLAGLATRLAGIAAALLMAVFVAGIVSVWARGMSIDCGCFGGGGTVARGQTNYLWDVTRDGGLFLLACWIAVFPASPVALDGALGLQAPAKR